MKITPRVHNELAAIRRHRAQCSYTWGVFRLTKRGQPSKLPTAVRPDLQTAAAEAARIGGLNPGATFVALPLRSL